MLFPCGLIDFSEKLNEIKVDDDGIPPMENVSGTTTHMDMYSLCLGFKITSLIAILPKW